MMKTASARRLAGLLAALAAAGLVAGCSSSAGNSGSSTDSGGTTSSSSHADTQAAQKYLASFEKNPSSILITSPLSKKPAPQTIVNLTLPDVPTDQVFSAGVKDAATTLGWNYKAISINSSATGVQNAFEAALETKPKPIAITTLGLSVDAFRPQLAQAKSMGIAVIATSDSDVPGTSGTAGLVARIQGSSTEAAWGKQLGAYIGADSKGAGQVALFTIPSYPILKAFDAGLKSGLTEFCPGCKLTEVDQQTTDLGTKTPQSVVSTLTHNPGIKYAVFAFGDVTLGVHPALSTAGISGVKILGVAPDPANLQAVRAGTEAAWVGTPIAYLGWRAIDAAARYANGDSESQENAAPDPVQLLTSDTIKHAVFDSSGNYVGVANYRQQFMKLWHISG